MRVLVVNAGSSSLKLSVVDDDRVLSSSASASLADFVAGAGEVDAVGHRIVHGGTQFDRPVAVDDTVVAALDALTVLAPLHQPASLRCLREARSLLPEVPHVACFDTAFHATIPPVAATYPLPAEWRERWPIRKFGFHGLSLSYAARTAAAMLQRPLDELRLVTCHLGSGASLCAVDRGRSVDTTMGMTPLDGLVMSTRAGSLDPGVVLWLVEHVAPTEVDDALQHRSGLEALCGTGDMRAVLARRADGDDDATFAFDVYVYRLRLGIAAMAAAMHGVDALVFTGGVGEHAPEVRDAVALEGVPCLVVEAREDIEIARGVRAIIRR
jgi:acetate kinase